MTNLLLKDYQELFAVLRENGYQPYFSGWTALNGGIEVDKEESIPNNK